LEGWMEEKDFGKIDDFRGKMSQSQIQNPAAFERVQFMKLYSKIV
jgi:dihydroorotate dehydrogenase (fumarate)